jgi:hypothetical protein
MGAYKCLTSSRKDVKRKDVERDNVEKRREQAPLLDVFSRRFFSTQFVFIAVTGFEPVFEP